MAVRGVVTKTNSGSKPYSAVGEVGNFIGTFVSLREAEVKIESAAGRRLKWVAETDATGTQRFVGQDL